jgi:myo-inositol-1-phosphate synthase
MEEIPLKKRAYKKSTIISGIVEKSQDKSSHYVDREEFVKALQERRVLVDESKANGTPMPRISEYIGGCIMALSKGLAKKYQFNGYSFKDEMVSDAIIHCLRYIDSFDPSRGTSPFSYFTQSCYYQFLARIQLEKTQQYIRYSRLLDSGSLNEVSQQPDAYSSFDIDMSELDTSHLSDFVSNYEKAIQRAAAKKPKRKTTMTTLDDIPESSELTEFVEDEILQQVIQDTIEENKKSDTMTLID